MLAESGFGVLGSIIFCLLGACGGLYALDYAFTARYLPLSLFDPTIWVFAAALGAALSMIAAALFKSLAVRA